MDEVTAVNLSILARARKLFAGLSRGLDGEIDRLQTALEIETENSRIGKITELIRLNQKALQSVLDLEIKLMRETNKQRPGEGVINLAQARAEVARRLDRIAS
jgi:hypothetical protein